MGYEEYVVASKFRSMAGREDGTVSSLGVPPVEAYCYIQEKRLEKPIRTINVSTLPSVLNFMCISFHLTACRGDDSLDLRIETEGITC